MNLLLSPSLIFLLVFTLSCSSIKNGPDTHAGVSIIDDYSNETSENNEKPKINGTDILYSEEGLVGPPLPNIPPEVAKLNEQVREPVVAFFLGPGLYRSFCHIGTLKALIRDGVPIHVIGGTEMGAVMATLFAKFRSPSMMEWHIFKLKQSLDRETEAFSNIWKKKFQKTIVNLFKKDLIQSFKVPLILPVFNKEKNAVEYLSRGPVEQILKVYLSLTTPNRVDKLQNAFLAEVFNESALKLKGADIVIFLDVIGSEISFENENDYLLGLYRLIFSKIEKEKKVLNHVFSIDTGPYKLDSYQEVATMLNVCEREGHQISPIIHNIILNWKNKLLENKAINQDQI